MNGCPVAEACAVACCMGEVSQQPMCPHCAHRRRCTHQPPAASHSTQPSPLGGTDGSIPAISLMSALLRILPGDREPYPEPRVTRRRLQGQVPVVLLHHDAPRDVQPEARSLAHRLGDEERFEYTVLDLRRDPGPGVAELHEHLVLAGLPGADREGP